MHKPTTTFDPLVYIDGTLAGLAILIPIPPVDWALETIFRRRMVGDIAARHGRVVSPEVRRIINQRINPSCWGCWLWPFTAVFFFFKRFSRKILYFLTIKEASDQVSYYWHRAFLLDYMLAEGHLETPEKAAIARLAMHAVLTDTTTSPLYKFAAEWIRGVQNNWRITLRLFRSRNIRQYLKDNETLLKDNWNEAAGYLSSLALRYNDLYAQIETEQKINLGETSATTIQNNPHEQQEKSGDSPKTTEKTTSASEAQTTTPTSPVQRSEEQEN